MAPSETKPCDDSQATMATAPAQTSVAGTPPPLIEPMRLVRTDSLSTLDTSLRGGERSAACPGRFCFIIPCPIPCDFCII